MENLPFFKVFIHLEGGAGLLPSTVAMSVIVISHALLHSILRVDSRESAKPPSK